jgi:hypothetical protein
VKRSAFGQMREQVRQAPASDGQKALVRGDAHDRLRDTERDDLLIGDPSAGVPWPGGQEIVHSAINSDQQQVEVGVHRGPLGSALAMSTADFDLRCHVPFPAATTPSAAALLI